MFFTKEDNGLDKFWAGKVWMNPPYATELIKLFAAKYAMHVQNGDISEGIVLVNNATETDWFNMIINVSNAVVFPNGRIKFLDPKGKPGSPLQGQAVIYHGDKVDIFLQEFGKYGWGARLC